MLGVVIVIVLAVMTVVTILDIGREKTVVSRYCSRCGSPRDIFVYTVSRGFNRQTGQPNVWTETYWGCIKGSPNRLNRFDHDGWLNVLDNT